MSDDSATATGGNERYKVVIEMEITQEVVATSEAKAYAKERSVIKHALPTANIREFDVEEVSECES